MSKITIRNFFIATIFLLIAIAGFSYMFIETSSQNEALKQQIETLKKEQAQEDSYMRLQRTAEESVGEREQLKEHFLLEQSDSIDFLNLVESLAPQAGVNLTTDTLKHESTDEEDWITADFTFTGTYADIYDFIRILENLPYLTELRTIELTENNDGSSWEAQVQVQVNLYSL